MRTYSTPQSALKGEITKLAIIECVASVVLYVGLGMYLRSFKYLAAAVATAPLMLFRTEFSADWGFRLYLRSMQLLQNMYEKLESRGATAEVIAMILLFMAIGVFGALIRIISTIYGFVRSPIQTLRESPRNWLRQALCTDFAHPPELIPKEAVAEDRDELPTFSFYVKVFQEENSFFIRVLGLLLISPIILLGWIPSVTYRVTFKATAIAYVPFIWVAHATLRNPLPLKARLERFTKGELEKVRRGISYLVLTTLVAKGALVINWLDRAKVESMFPSQKVVSEFVVLDAWPWWQITFGADALLTFILLFFADTALARLEGEKPWPEASVMTTVYAISFVRASLGIITMSHFFYIALAAVAPESVRHFMTS